jgi:non-canonical (house-cleaning) NTP pyrophosphatase
LPSLNAAFPEDLAEVVLEEVAVVEVVEDILEVEEVDSVEGNISLLIDIKV